MPAEYDVFLCHSSQDKPAVGQLADKLRQHGITPWLDAWHIRPGDPWMPALGQALGACRACAVFIGQGGLAPWQNEELQVAINQKVEQGVDTFRVIPVLLPGADRGERSRLPPFLSNNQWVEFRKGLDDEDAFRLLLWGLRGGDSQQALATMRASSLGLAEPYRGLHFFDERHAAIYFGREALIGWLLHGLRPSSRESGGDSNRFLAIIGPSGSGKSSLARAGLVHALRQGGLEDSGDWPIAILRPERDPLESLGIAFAKLSDTGQNARAVLEFERDLLADERALHIKSRMLLHGTPTTRRLVLVIDQFEEIFTLCKDEARRRSFIDNLLHASSTAVGGQTIVILTMRADFYGHAAPYPQLAAALSDHPFLVGPMTPDQLRSAIAKPAELFACKFEAGLIDELVRAVQDQPGALPLLQHTLLELWEARKDRGLTMAAYQAIGRLEGALERRAEKVFGQFTAAEKELCRKVFLQMTRLGSGTEDTRRQAPINELLALDPDSGKVEAVLQSLASPEARLVTLESGSEAVTSRFAEVSHEALMRVWPRLRRWIEEEGEGLRIRDRIREAAQEWGSQGKNEGFLYRGPRLAQAWDWAERNPQQLREMEWTFLRESRHHDEHGRRLSDSATLDQLTAAAPHIWFDDTRLSDWLGRARALESSLEKHKRQLEMLRKGSETAPGVSSVSTSDSSDQVQYDTLAVLVNRLEDAKRGLFAAAKHVEWVASRRDESNSAEVEGRWAKTVASIGSTRECPVYGGLTLAPQPGLIPLRRNPGSGLWEFLHLRTGVEPTYDEGRPYRLDEMTGVILILIPGLQARIGCVPVGPESKVGDPHVDPFARDEEGPVHSVSLDPYFLSKYPMTQGQWLRACGQNPSHFTPARGASLLHPVECVSWEDCTRVLPRVGLTLPTEAQSECAVRAGTTSVWWLGNDPALVKGAANLRGCRDEADDLPQTSPVDRYPPNPFGLFDAIGNVWEWTSDGYGKYTLPTRAGDGMRLGTDEGSRVCRGSSFFNNVEYGRSAVRYFHCPPKSHYTNLGVRPAYAVAK